MEKHVLPNEVMLGEVDRLLAEGHDVVMIPKGRSMLPFIRGEKDSVKLRKKNQVMVGDIVLARFDGHYILHRVIGVDGLRVSLMGDGNLKGIEQGEISEVCGTVVEIITPKGRVRRPNKAWLWRRLLPVRKYLLKIYRKWNKIFANN